jgi:hypothetical protein
LIAGEVVVQQMHVPASLPIAHRIPHPVLGWRTEPGAQVVYATSEFRVPVVYNSKGWRDSEHEYAKPPGTYRAIVLGDSFMEAYAVPFQSTFAHQIESLMSARRNERIEVINLGVGGYGTLQEYLAFVEEGVKYQPDLVLLGFFTNNDLSDNSLAISRTIRREASLRLRSRPFLDGSVEWRIVPPDYASAKEAFERSRPNTSPFAPVRLVKESALYSLLGNARQAEVRGQEGHLSSDAYRSVYQCREAPEYGDAWQLTGRILSKLAAAVRASGAELFVFSVPSQIELEPTPSDTLCLAQPPSSTRLPHLLAGNQIPYIDLLPAFREAHRQGAILHWQMDGHWNEQGHALAARYVDAALSQSGR